MPSRADFLTTGLESVSKPPEDVNCGICQEHSKTDLIRLPCHHTHIFCKPCIGEWLQRPGVKNCPQCRKKLFDLLAGEAIPEDEGELDLDDGSELRSLTDVEGGIDWEDRDELRSLTTLENYEEQESDESDSDSEIDAMVDDEELHDLEDDSSDDDVELDGEDDDSEPDSDFVVNTAACSCHARDFSDSEDSESSDRYQSDSDASDSSSDEDMEQ